MAERIILVSYLNIKGFNQTKIKMSKIKFSVLVVALMVSVSSVSAQNEEVTANNSWLKVGVNAGVPVGDASDFTSFKTGLELKGQYLVNPHFGIGLTAGYNQYFGKDGFDDFGAIPVGAMLRYYAKNEGFFAGVDGGYNFFTNVGGNEGAAFVKPQIGYHNYNWNYFAYYNAILQSDTKGPDVNDIGVGVSYNIRFKKK